MPAGSCGAADPWVPSACVSINHISTFQSQRLLRGLISRVAPAELLRCSRAQTSDPEVHWHDRVPQRVTAWLDLVLCRPDSATAVRADEGPLISEARAAGRPGHQQLGALWLGECAWLLVLQSLFCTAPPVNSALRALSRCADACQDMVGGGRGSVS